MDLPSRPLEAVCSLKDLNGESGSGGGGSINRFDDIALPVRPGQDIAGGCPSDLTSTKGFAQESIERLYVLDRSMDRLIGGR